jgi:hypothetical protein
MRECMIHVVGIIIVCVFFFCVDPLLFPVQLSDYGLTVELLSQALESAQSESGGEVPSSWSLCGVPYVEFYRQLHEFLKKWEKTRSSTKTSIGRFYISIDRQLKERGSSPNNTYKFIERIVSSTLPDTSVMLYNFADGASAKSEVQDCHEQVNLR